jgi:hypothetical protein
VVDLQFGDDIGTVRRLLYHDIPGMLVEERAEAEPHRFASVRNHHLDHAAS